MRRIYHLVLSEIGSLLATLGGQPIGKSAQTRIGFHQAWRLIERGGQAKGG
ncbi:hypothetical protein AGABI2DRAFT_135145, partial [Agaricus bisporus var. bisporus H97]